MNSRDAGLRASTPSLKCRKKNFISGLVRLSTETMAPFCANSCADADSISSCSPTPRKISMVRWWNEAARGWTAVPRCRSTSRCGTSRAASSNDVDSPTRLPPTISHGHLAVAHRDFPLRPAPLGFTGWWRVGSIRLPG